jgi:predicted DNA-binding transcriptional regulator AlpA
MKKTIIPAPTSVDSQESSTRVSPDRLPAKLLARLRTCEPAIFPSAPADRLITFREVNSLLGLACKTGHTARAYAARGLIRAVRINERVVRFSEASVHALVAGKEVAR